MQLDHIFVFVDDIKAAEDIGRSIGLTETYRRTHIGQGTANVCYCFENAFLELLFLTDAAEAASPAIERTGLLQRAAWRRMGTCPVGIAWRLGHQEAAPLFSTWPFRPPYLPDNMHIPVATESDDLAVPLLFQSPGTAPPIEWPSEKRGMLQQPSGQRHISKIFLTSPHGFIAGPALRAVLRATDIVLEEGSVPGWGVRLLAQNDGGDETSLEILTQIV